MEARAVCAVATALLLGAAEAAVTRDTVVPPKEGSSRIIDGRPARLGQFPFQALIVADDNDVCGGSLITPSAVLTAAWCTARYKKFTVRLGGVHRTEDEKTAWIVVSIWALAHPLYNTVEYEDHNVAVVFLPFAAPLGDYIELVQLPSFDEIGDTFAGKTAIIAGWGHTGYGADISETLQWTEVQVIPNSICKLFFPARYILNSTLCAGKDNRGFCAKDEGGALVLRTGATSYKQIGVASRDVVGCEDAAPNTYARVTSFLEWITAHVGEDY